MSETKSEAVTCPKCGHKSEENSKKLERDGYTCPHCGYSCPSNELVRTDEQPQTDEEGFERATKSLRRD
jgi:transposase-like protein